jgi:hypothetical protein
LARARPTLEDMASQPAQKRERINLGVECVEDLPIFDP